MSRFDETLAQFLARHPQESAARARQVILWDKQGLSLLDSISCLV